MPRLSLARSNSGQQPCAPFIMWSRIQPGTVHLLYLCIGAFLCLFMLFSSFVKETMYFGEANIALLVGAILGPFATKAVNPNIWTHFDIVVLEFSRVVLIIQCFAVALELPKFYVRKHWRSLLWVVGPVVIWGWMVCTLLVWFMVPHLSWIQSMTIASCFNAIDPVLASTVVGKAKFAKRIPKHIRDLLLAESASNDVTTSVAVGLSILLTRYPGPASGVARSLFAYTIGYQILLAGTVGLVLGKIFQQALRAADKHESTDRESFLSFYIMASLFCAGIGSLIGVDDVLLAFCAGYAFDKDGWFRMKTEESFVSQVVDLLINLTFFVFLGALIPWRSFNQPLLNIHPWRLVVGTLLIFLLRRIPAILLLKPVIPDIKTWREALFYGHFGPIGVGAIFSAALISSDPGRTGIAGNLLAVDPHDSMQTALWPVVTFVVLCSSIVHGSSVPVWAFWKQINTLELTMTYTAGGDHTLGWLNRLPRITSTGRESQRSAASFEIGDLPPGMLPPFLRRQRPDLSPSRSQLSSSIPRRRQKKKWEDLSDTGSPSRPVSILLDQKQHVGSRRSSLHETIDVQIAGPSSFAPDAGFGDGAAAPEQSVSSKEERSGEHGAIATKTVPSTALNKDKNDGNWKTLLGWRKRETKRKRGPATAYQFGNTIIVEDEDGEVVKTYELPAEATSSSQSQSKEAWYKFSIGGVNKRLRKDDFLREIQSLDPTARAVNTLLHTVTEESMEIASSAREDERETEAERRRREAALRGTSDDLGGDSHASRSLGANTELHLPSSEIQLQLNDEENLSEDGNGEIDDGSSSPRRRRSPKGKERAAEPDD